jgi:aspartyl protease family protein
MMRALTARLALPVLIAGLACLGLRVIIWPFQSALPALAPFALAAMSGLLLMAALLAAALAWNTLPGRNAIAWTSALTAFGAIAFIDADYDSWQVQRMWHSGGPIMTADRPPREAGTITLDRSADGHYYIDAQVNSGTVKFLVDTGATVVALDLEDARAAGLRTDTLVFNIPVQTAAGQAMAAPVIIPVLTLEGHAFSNVQALVMRGGGQSLLGMSVLNQFDSMELRQNQLILRR